MILLLISLSALSECAEHIETPAPSLQEVVASEMYARVEEYYEDFAIERDFETLVGYYPCVTLTNPNLNHLQGDLTRRLTGAAAHFG